MKIKNGFTLVELLAVIVLIGLLMTIAIPSALKMSSRVKSKGYDTKIDIIEASAINYGQSKLSSIRRGLKPGDSMSKTCTMIYDESLENIEEIQVNSKKYSETESLGENEYWCVQLTVDELVDGNNLNYDSEGLCNENCETDADRKNYDNVILNPKTDYIINQCYVYVYYKYNRVYSVFDEKTCSVSTETPMLGHEYRRMGNFKTSK